MDENLTDDDLKKIKGIMEKVVSDIPKTYLENVVREVIPTLPFWKKAEQHYLDHVFINNLKTIWGVIWKAGAAVIGVLAINRWFNG